MDLGSFASVLASTFSATYVILIFIAPIALGWFFIDAYITFKRNDYVHRQNPVLLELKLPHDIMKSPLAMELFLSALYQTKGESTWYSRYFEGKVRPWFSLELVSHGGVIKYYIWTWAYWKELIVNQLYSQFPGIEVSEAPDYTAHVKFNPDKNDLYGTDILLTKPDCYPIKSYADYLLDKDQEEEMKVDPMTPVFEFLGSLKPEEEVWMQIIIRAHRKERPKHGGGMFEKADWTDGAKHEIDNIKNKDTQQVESLKLTGLSLTKGEKDKIEAIERNIAKIPFDTGIRLLYHAPLKSFKSTTVGAVRSMFRQYNTSNLNSFATGSHETDYDFPWQDPIYTLFGYGLNRKKREFLAHYQHRSFFYRPDPGHWFTLNTESLATIYHFPGQVAKTGALHRVEAKKAEPPANLPI